MRILDDDHIRPTTLEHTETPLRVKHSLVTEVRYRLKGSKLEMTLECSTKVTIASCCCLQDSLLLPGYVKQRPVDEPLRSFHRRCLCNRSLQGGFRTEPWRFARRLRNSLTVSSARRSRLGGRGRPLWSRHARVQRAYPSTTKAHGLGERAPLGPAAEPWGGAQLREREEDLEGAGATDGQWYCGSGAEGGAGVRGWRRRAEAEEYAVQCCSITVYGQLIWAAMRVN